jgi:glucose-1-phosphate cytidylyltransferase
LTGGRLHRLEPHLRDGGTFMLTYGDGVADVNVAELLAFHQRHGRIATLTAVRPPARFGTMSFDGDRVIDFKEKPQTQEGWINGGFFVFEPEVFDYLNGDQTVLEGDPLEQLAADGELMAYRHEGFWQCMDTLRDRNRLESLWETGAAPWKVWE